MARSNLPIDKRQYEKTPPLRMSFSLVGGGGGNWPFSPANAPACALAFAGSQQCCSNSLLTPRPFRTWFQSPHQLHMQQIKMATLTGSHFYLLVEAGGIGLAGRAFACRRMPLRATNSTQVLFV